jgi:DNA repair exonuclease SbcCD ATPase subunit
MSDQRVSGDASPGRVCPWCSAPLPAVTGEKCPSCGASLQGEGEAQLPGLTTIDPVAILEGTKQPTRTRSSRLMAWITGSDIEEEAQPIASSDALAPPSEAVRLEMLRLETEAELARKSAEVEAMAADEALDAQDRGDTAAANEAVEAVIETDARTDDLIEYPEEIQVERSAGAAAESATPTEEPPAEATPSS